MPATARDFEANRLHFKQIPWCGRASGCMLRHTPPGGTTEQTKRRRHTLTWRMTGRGAWHGGTGSRQPRTGVPREQRNQGSSSINP